MAISKPVAIYNAENNLEAQLVCAFRDQNGIESHPTFDESMVGYWSFGVLPEIHKPQVWVDEANVDSAKLLIVEYESEQRRRRSKDSAQTINTGSLDVVCEECGRTTAFPTAKKGTTQDCSHCGAYVDFG